MKVLILRTFAHNRVWVNERNSCEFEPGQWLGMIDKWEPDYENFVIEDFKFGLGIYTSKYFTHVLRYSSKPAYSHTPEEENISILKLRPYSDSGHFSIVRDNQLFVYYNYCAKLFSKPNRRLMERMDREFIEEKQRELVATLGEVPSTAYLPLSFTLNLDATTRIIRNNGLNYEYLVGI